MATPSDEFKRYFPANFELETTRVILRPLQREDLPAFLELAKSEETWKYFYKDLGKEDEMRQWVDDAIREREEGKRMPFAITVKTQRRFAAAPASGTFHFSTVA